MKSISDKICNPPDCFVVSFYSANKNTFGVKSDMSKAVCQKVACQKAVCQKVAYQKVVRLYWPRNTRVQLKELI